MKSWLIDFWENRICERTNRKALKHITRANYLWHKGGFNCIFAMLLHNRNIKRYNCEIYPQADIGTGLYIPHCVGIVVGNTTVLGNNCTIFPNVVFGAAYHSGESNPKGRRHPLVGDNCVFGANSTIIGAITVGDNVTVGAGAVVSKDIPDNTVVVGHNRIISKGFNRNE